MIDMVNMNEINKLVEKAVSDFGSPSASVGIFKDGEMAYTYAGVKNAEKNLEPDENTMYAIGSASKAFTATAIAILADEGKIDFEKPIKHYMPEFEMFDPYVTENLTVRDILCHRCGLPRHEFMWYLNLENYTLKDIMDRLRYLKPNQPFRYNFQYQNHMFMLAGYLIEKISGKKWDIFIKERIIDPLGMSNTNFDKNGYYGYENKALPYMVNEDKTLKELKFKDINEVGSAGSINSTAADMLKWIQMNLNKGMVGSTRIVSEKNLEECHRPQMVANEPKPWKFDEIDMNMYGFGWFIETYKGTKVLHHGGSIDGFISLVTFIPSLNMGFVVLTNHDEGRTSSAIQYSLYDILLGKDKTDWIGRFREISDKLVKQQKDAYAKIREISPKGTTPTHTIEEYAGVYENDAYGVYDISVKNGVLSFSKGGFDAEFLHLAHDNFIMRIDERNMEVKAKFDYDSDGVISSLNMEFEANLVEPIKFNKKK